MAVGRTSDGRCVEPKWQGDPQSPAGASGLLQMDVRRRAGRFRFRPQRPSLGLRVHIGRRMDHRMRADDLSDFARR